MNTIPKGDFACHLCYDEIKSTPKKTLIKTLSSSSTRSHHSHTSNNDNISTIISDPVAQIIDGMSNFFLPNKQKPNHIRQQSVQKAMKYLREKKTLKSSNKNLLKRLHSSPINSRSNEENELLGKNLLTSSKKQRIKRILLNEDLSSKYKIIFNFSKIFNYIF